MFSKCQKAYYFDETSEACLPCHHICHQAEARGTESLCRKLCPVDIPLDLVTASIKSESFVQVPSLETKTHDTYTFTTYSGAEVAIVVLATLIILLTVVALLLLYSVYVKTWVCRKIRHRNRQQEITVQDSLSKGVY